MTFDFQGFFRFAARLLGDIGYRRIGVRAPASIVRNFRSGAAFLHRLMYSTGSTFPPPARTNSLDYLLSNY